jgi:transcriptional regulator with XRE-family HTH domain
MKELAEKVSNLPSNNGKARTPHQIGYIERGERSLSLEWACLLAEALDVRVEYLLCKDEYRTVSDYEQRFTNGITLESLLAKAGYTVKVSKRQKDSEKTPVYVVEFWQSTEKMLLGEGD